MDFSQEKSILFLRGAAQALYDENARLREENERLRARLGEQTQSASEELAVMRQLLDKRNQALFGRSSERRKQEGEAPQKSTVPQKGHGPTEQPGLETVIVEHELPPSACVCPECGGTLVPLGAEVEESEVISVNVRSFTREIHRRKKYRCRCNACVKTAPGPLKLLDGGRYSPEFAVEVAVGKYADHLPLERQLNIMRREGLVISSQTLWDQIDSLAKVLSPTYEAILAAILQNPVVGMDETRWPLLDNGKLKENKNFQTWCLVCPEMVAFRIIDSRSKLAASTILGDYRGIVMADGYAVYQSLAQKENSFTLANCWAHARRKFVEAEKNFPTESQRALEMIGELYRIERETPKEQRPDMRREKSRPVAEALFVWAEGELEKVLPRSGIAEALKYLLKLKSGLMQYLDDDRIPIDNNASERALRSVVVGRKNHYGSRSRRGTEVAAIFYTLMECARIADVSPKAYLLAVTKAALENPGAMLLPAGFKADCQSSDYQEA